MPLTTHVAALNTFTKNRGAVLSLFFLFTGFACGCLSSAPPSSPPPPLLGLAARNWAIFIPTSFFWLLVLAPSRLKRSMRRGLGSQGASGRNVRPPSYQIALHTWQITSVGRIQFLVIAAISRSPAASRGFQAKFETANKQFQTLRGFISDIVASLLTLTFSFQG